MNAAKVSVIIVTMNPRERLGACLDSLKAKTRTPFEVRVTAHRCKGEDVAWLRVAYPWTTVVESDGRARGFAENNNLAAKGARGEYIFLLNDDTVLDTDAVDRLAGLLDARPDAGIASPYLLNRDGSVQFCGGVEMTPWTWFLAEMRWRRIVDMRNSSVGAGGVFETQNAMGAAMMIRRKLWEEVGGLDERFVFGPEDTALSVAARERGWKILVDEGARIYHLQSESLKRNFIPVMLAYQRGCAIHYGRKGPLAALWVRLLLTARDSLKLAGWLPKGGGENAVVHRRLWWLMLRTVWSRATPKELFVRFGTEVREGFVAENAPGAEAGRKG
ncbi:MAG: glycosyltransferase family 2 protein [Kiritimatiellae bacterium]|nr:glycosyltransferase family 2 protein [Kiritimatiellia bacterium]